MVSRRFLSLSTGVDSIRDSESCHWRPHDGIEEDSDGVVNNNDPIPLRRTDKFANVATDLVRYQRKERDRLRIPGTRTQRTADLNLQYHRLAFRYNPAVDYSSSRHVVIGQMSHVCTYYQALKFNDESSSFLIHATIMCHSEAWQGTASFT
ncbi:hypothetical protein AVEN_181355-1 [Araneus ventricosus]|uniref:Helitron helicase-like domain-containing protein n=1 Tax=Araneus ventricosus TaxID=182803 RepID=A0A4Y2SZW0_ARAVE|nr:hypothetical protein AVEN_181355-1 [Araneus ventricosus]